MDVRMMEVGKRDGKERNLQHGTYLLRLVRIAGSRSLEGTNQPEISPGPIWRGTELQIFTRSHLQLSLRLPSHTYFANIPHISFTQLPYLSTKNRKKIIDRTTSSRCKPGVTCDCHRHFRSLNFKKTSLELFPPCLFLRSTTYSPQRGNKRQNPLLPFPLLPPFLTRKNQRKRRRNATPPTNLPIRVPSTNPLRKKSGQPRKLSSTPQRKSLLQSVREQSLPAMFALERLSRPRVIRGKKMKTNSKIPEDLVLVSLSISTKLIEPSLIHVFRSENRRRVVNLQGRRTRHQRRRRG